MTTFFSYCKNHKLPSRASIHQMLTRPLSWYGVVLYTLSSAILIVLYIWILQINNQFLVSIPARGGSVTEGMIGSPHVINPVLATTDTDTALTKLLFSGLMKYSPEGSIVPDLAASVTTSPDGLTYTFALREKLKWSDGKALTSDDVSFTIDKLNTFAPDPRWQGATVATPDTHTVVVTLPTPRNDLLAAATIGILPKHIWADIPNELFETASANIHPVGSGPYKYRRLSQSNGIITKIVLTRNTRALTHTYIDHYAVSFFANQTELLDALDAGSIDLSLAANAETAAHTTGYTIESIPSPLTVGLFRAQNDPLLNNSAVTTILNQMIDKKAILATVEHGYGILSDEGHSPSLRTDEALAALQKLGYAPHNGVLEKNGVPVGFALNVENDPPMLVAAHALADQLGQIGVLVIIKAFDRGTFQSALNTGEYKIFLGRLRSAPSGYASVIPLYTVAYPFIHTDDLHIQLPEYLDSPGDRYRTQASWHTRINKIWKIFSHNNQ